MTYYVVSSPRDGRPPCPVPTPPGGGIPNGAPAFGVLAPQHRFCTRRPCPRGTQLGLGRGISPEHRSRGARPNLGPKMAKAGQKRPKMAIRSRCVLRGRPRSVQPMGSWGGWQVGQESETSENPAIHRRQPPSARPPEGWVVGLTEGPTPWKMKLGSRLVTSGHLKSLLAAGSGVGKSTPPAIPRGVLVRPVRCGPESGQPEGLKPE